MTWFADSEEEGQASEDFTDSDSEDPDSENEQVSQVLCINEGSKRKRVNEPDNNQSQDNQKKSKALEINRQRKEYQKLINEYYSEGSFFGSPITNIVYTLASQLGRENNLYLW